MTSDEIKKSLSDYSIGDILHITHRLKKGDEIRSAKVIDINYNGNGLVTYTNHYIEGMLNSGSGAFDPDRIGTKPFGIVKIEKVGHQKPTAHWSPKPGDRSYDLMC